jgi:autotransporter-associated beta strand protein
VVIPQSPSYTPLQVFSNADFLGAPTLLGIYTYYTNNALGAMNANIGSFKLKRGYLATFAQNADGSGISQVYVAQDGELDVAVLPAGLDHAARFVRVFPWRWTSKKGWVGGVQPLVNEEWEYDYDNVATSTLDVEYVPMRDTANWDAYSNINGKQGSTHVLGFNEPDQTNQANMTVAQAIADWPNLTQSGLRLGAPAVSSSGVTGQGLDWLYSFMSQAEALNYRVDFVPVHFYQCGWTAAQFTNYLWGVYQQTGRPVWVTEFNYGASWCSGTPPTLQQEASAIASYVSALESAPYVERYSIYSYFPSNWAEVVGTTLTPAGVIYSNAASAMAYSQALPAGGARGIAQLQFSTNTLDSSGYGNDGMAVGIPSYSTGPSGQSIVMDGTNSYVQLPPNMGNSNAFSFAGWVYWNGGANWQRIFDFGNDMAHYMFLTPSSSSSTLRFAIDNNGGEQRVETSQLPIGQWTHVAFTLSGNTATLYTNGLVAGSTGTITISPSSFAPAKNYLGKSQFPADPLFGGQLSQVLITDYALTAAQIASLMTFQPPQFATNIIAGGSATQGQLYTNSVAGDATDPNPGDTLTYSKASGPAWLTVNANGTISGTPGSLNGGTNYFTILVTDSAGQSAFALLTVILPIINNNGTWIVDASGNWSTTNLWSGNTIANGAGFTADFSTLNITANRTVTLDSSRSIGTLKFGDPSGGQNWTLASSGGSALTLDTGSITVPSIVVNQNTATIAAPLAGVNGFTKSSAGTLILSGFNTLGGTLYADTGQPSTGNDGVLRLAGPGAIGTVTNLDIRNENSATSTLQLDGTSGNVSVSAHMAVNCRNTSVATIENLAGTNTLSGSIELDIGGSLFNIQSDAGLLIFSGTNQYGGSLTGGRAYAFSGAGNHLVSGPILNSTNGAPIALTKSGAGQLTLAAANTYTNGTTVNGGTLVVNGSIISNVTVASSATLGGGGFIKGPVSVQSGGTLSPGPPITLLTISNTLSLTGTTFMEVDKTNATNDSVRVTSKVTYGGTLTVTNLTSTMTGGESYQLFNAGSFTGAFATTNFPPLTPGLGWNFNPTNGVLSVVVVGPTNPSGLTATAGNAQVALNWNPLAGAASYNVKRATVSGGPYTVLGNTAGTSYIDSNVVSDSTYYYVVSAVNTGGESPNSSEVSAYVLSVFEQWQTNYFGCTTCPQAQPNADPLGKGMSNTNQFLAGLNPTNPASMFQILSVVPQGNDIVLTWQAAGIRTNAVQSSPGDGSGDYSNNFSDIIGSQTIFPSVGDAVTNFTDLGGATNAASRFYRVRLIP